MMLLDETIVNVLKMMHMKVECIFIANGCVSKQNLVRNRIIYYYMIKVELLDSGLSSYESYDTQI